MIKINNQEEIRKSATTFLCKKYSLKKMPYRNTKIAEKTLLNFISRGPNTAKKKKNVYALSVI